MLLATGFKPPHDEPWMLAPFGSAGSGSGLTSGAATGVWLTAPDVTIEATLEEGTGFLRAYVGWFRMFHEPATGACVEVRQPAVEGAPRARVHSPAEMLGAVRAHLSLSMVDVAAALEVERPTIYAWLAGRSEPQERNRRRLHRLSELAHRWSRLSNSPLGARLRHPDETGTSLLDLLRSGRFEEAEGRLGALAQTHPGAASGRRLRSLQEVLVRHGLEDRIRPTRDEIERLTGNRSLPE